MPKETAIIAYSTVHTGPNSQLGGAHVELLSRLRNPIGLKLGPGVTPAEVRALVEKLDPDAEVTIARTPQMSREEHQLALAYLLTPLGWREKRRPAIAKRRELALAEWEESTDPERNLALVAELDELSLFLEAVERDAHLVTATRTREQFVGNIPLGGFDRGS